MCTPASVEPFGCRERALAADRDDGVNAVFGHDLVDAIHPAVCLERVRTRGTENRAALLADALDVVASDRHDVIFDDTLPTVAKADELIALSGLDAAVHDAANDRV